MVDIGRIKDLLGLGEDKSEALEVATEKQILPGVQKKKPGRDAKPSGEDKGPAQPILERADPPCAWCEKPCLPDKDGFHLVHIAFGTTQERHCFCSDECYEAFRRMYPSRVHRNCYERKCADCAFCIKRYTDESDGFRASENDADKRAVSAQGKV